MVKRGILTLLGCFLLGFSILLGYFYFNSLNDNGNLLFFALALVVMAGSVFSLFKATKEDITPDAAIVSPVAGNETGGMVKQNNDLSANWAKTIDTRNKLKVLGMSDTKTSEGK